MTRTLSQTAARVDPRTWAKLGFRVLTRAAANFSEDRGPQLAASISYFALFSLFPLTLLAVSIFGTLLRDQALQDRVLTAIIEFLPIEGSFVADALRGVAALGPTVGIVSFFGALWSAGALSSSVRQSLDRVFEVQLRRPLVRARLIDFVLLPVIALPLLGGVVLTGVLRFAQAQIAERLGLLDGALAWTWDVGALFIPLLLSFTAFAALYRLAPNRTLAFRYIVPGALFSALAFEGLKAGFALYLQHFANYTIYGSLGSVIALLFWVYLTGIILIFGGEICVEASHAMRDEPRHGGSEEGDWKRALLRFAQGLVMVTEDDDRPVRRREGVPDPAVPLPPSAHPED